MTKPELKKQHDQGVPVTLGGVGSSSNVSHYWERDFKATIHQIYWRRNKKPVLLERHRIIWNNNVIFLKTDLANRKTENMYVLKGSED